MQLTKRGICTAMKKVLVLYNGLGVNYSFSEPRYYLIHQRATRHTFVRLKIRFFISLTFIVSSPF